SRGSTARDPPQALERFPPSTLVKRLGGQPERLLERPVASRYVQCRRRIYPERVPGAAAGASLENRLDPRRIGRWLSAFQFNQAPGRDAQRGWIDRPFSDGSVANFPPHAG